MIQRKKAFCEFCIISNCVVGDKCKITGKIIPNRHLYTKALEQKRLNAGIPVFMGNVEEKEVSRCQK